MLNSKATILDTDPGAFVSSDQGDSSSSTSSNISEFKRVFHSRGASSFSSEQSGAWDAELLDAYSTASLMLLASPLVMRRRVSAVRRVRKETQGV